MMDAKIFSLREAILNQTGEFGTERFYFKFGCEPRTVGEVFRKLMSEKKIIKIRNGLYEVIR